MKLIKGLQTDSNEQDQPEGSYVWALNWVANAKAGSLVSERGFQYKFTLAPELSPIGIMPTSDKVVIFSTNGLEQPLNKSEIGIYDEKTQIYTPILNDAIVDLYLGGTNTGLNFRLEHQIKSIYRYNSKNELEIAFTDWFNPPRIMYLGDPAVMTFYYKPYSINKLNVFQTANLGEVGVTIQTSGSLIADTYFFFYRYKNIDQTTTNAYIHPRPLYIIESSTSENYIDITGNAIGVTTNKSITVNFTVIDPTFPFIEIGLYRVSTAEALVIDTINSSQGTATITSFIGVTILPEDILAPKVFYDKAKTITSLNDQLMLGNLEKSLKTIPQKYINNLSLRWTCTFIKPAVEKASKDYNKQLKSFCAGEVYGMLIRFLLKDGTYTQWQHIPGRKSRDTVHNIRNTVSSNLASPAANPPDGYISSKTIDVYVANDRATIPPGDPYYSNYTNSDTNNKYFHTTDTCDVTSSTTINKGTYMAEHLEGTMGYWENENEQYSEYFQGEDAEIWNSVFQTGNLADVNGTTVRHHRFPTLHFLETNSSDTDNFTTKFPQLGVKITNLNIPFLQTLVGPIQAYEIGFLSRDFNNCTVYAQDLSLFGVYASPAYDPYNPVPPQPLTVYNAASASKDAIYFTGGNSVVSAVSFESDQTTFGPTGNITGENANDLFNFHHTPHDLATPDNNTSRLPNRQRFHTPDLVDPFDSSKDPLILPSFVRHEVLMVCGDVTQTNIPSPITPGGKALYAIETQSSATITASSYSLIDYCFDTDNLNTDLDITKYINFCIKNMPVFWVHRNIKASGYVPKTTRGVHIGDGDVMNALFNITTGGGDLYGGNNHFHVQLFDFFFDRMIINPAYVSENYPDSTQDIMAAYASFLTQILYSGAGQFFPPGGTPDTADFYNRHPVPSLNFSKARIDSAGIRQHHTAFLSSLVKHTKTIYNNFTALTPVVALSDDADSTIFLGDCFISEVQYITHGWGNPVPLDSNSNYASQNFMAYRFYAHTRRNLDYRYEKDNEPGTINKYYPASRFNVNKTEPTGIATLAEIFFREPTVGPNDRNHSYQGFNYAPTYGFQPIFTRVSLIFSNSIQTGQLTKFPFRVHVSEKQAKESLVNNWRVFLPLNYHENDKTKGEITNLQGYDDQLLIHTIQSLFFTRDRGNLESTAAGITIGTGGLFDFPPKEVIFDNLGYTGTQHQFGCVMTKLGYAFPDAQQGKYFIYNKDSGMVELSQQGLFNYFKVYGRCSHNDYSPFPTDTDIPPTLNSSGLSSWNGAYDEYNNRLLIGFNNKVPLDPNSYTLSYADSFKSFTSFHSYIPDLICNTRQNVYSFKGSDFFKHNTPNRGYYGLEAFPRQEIDIVYNTCLITTKDGIREGGKTSTKLWQSFNWHSEVHDFLNTAVFNLETFTQASVRTKRQASELMTLVPFTNVRIFDNNWHFNEFRDRLNRMSPRFAEFTPFVDSLNNGFTVTYPINTGFNSRFVDNYVILRLIYTPTNLGRELHLIEVDYKNQIVKK